MQDILFYFSLLFCTLFISLVTFYPEYIVNTETSSSADNSCFSCFSRLTKISCYSPRAHLNPLCIPPFKIEIPKFKIPEIDLVKEKEWEDRSQDKDISPPG